MSTSKVGAMGLLGDGKLQPFMVGFFRAVSRSTATEETAKLALPLDFTKEVLENDSRGHRVRRQTPNRKRSKDNEEFGSWNPYTGFFIFNIGFHLFSTSITEIDFSPTRFGCPIIEAQLSEEESLRQFQRFGMAGIDFFI